MAKNEQEIALSSIFRISDILTQLKADIQNRYLVKDMIVYLIFLAFLLGYDLSAGTSVLSAYSLGSALQQTFLGVPIPLADARVPKYFSDIQNYDDLWAWIDGAFYPTVYPTTAYNGDTLSSTEQMYLANSANRLLWGVRLRQVRVKSGSCQIPSRILEEALVGFDYNCAPSYDASVRDTTPLIRPSTTYLWEDEGLYASSSVEFQGTLATYDGSGYTAYISTDPVTARSQLDDLKSDLWLDQYTRGLFITISTYNLNSNLFGFTRLVVEMGPDGFFYPKATFRAVQAEPRTSESKNTESFLLLILTGFVFYYVFRFGYEIYLQQINFWFFLDLLNMSLFIVQFSYRWSGMFSFKSFPSLADTNWFNLDSIRQSFGSVEALESNRRYVEELTAFNLLLSFIRVFKFLTLNKKLSILFYTMEAAAPDLINFFVLFILLFGGFAVSAFFIFGISLFNYRSMTNCISMLAQIILGNSDYDELRLASPYLAPIFFASFVMLFTFILISIFLAIILDAYQVVAENAAASNGQNAVTKDVRRFWKKLKKICRNPLHRSKKIPKKRLFKRLMALSKMKPNDLVRFQELQEILTAEGMPPNQLKTVCNGIPQVEEERVVTDDKGVMSLRTLSDDKKDNGPVITDKAELKKSVVIKSLKNQVQGLIHSHQQNMEFVRANLDTMRTLQEQQVIRLAKLKYKLDSILLKN
eukprot:GILK01010353.1.p1 GENE.GILK01010353.1~~GILK01010353.1.p1  ORF type:complete len:699 (+),score=157.33 GILK01010353.1:146-2242(+)